MSLGGGAAVRPIVVVAAVGCFAPPVLYWALVVALWVTR